MRSWISGLHYISIGLELVVAVLGVLIATLRKKEYGWGILVTFMIYVFYDVGNFVNLGLPRHFWVILFFIATVSMVLSVSAIFWDLRRKDPR